MFIGTFTERPYQDPNSGYFGAAGRSITDLSLSNSSYNPRLGAELYNRYLDERVYAEEMGFDGLMLNEHHSTPFCMGGVMNVEAAILARITQRAKIVLLGNVLPNWDDPLWLAEELAEIDMISRGAAGDRPGSGAPVARAFRTMRSRRSTGSASRRRTTSSSRPGRGLGRSAGRASTSTIATSTRGRARIRNLTRRSGSPA